MKKNKLYTIAAAFGAVLALTSCNSFLDKMPDNRAEVDNEAKITSLLVSAYPTHSSDLLMEMGTDNVSDNGAVYGNAVNQQEIYKWKPVTTEGNDDPKGVWQAYYKAIASANEALQAIDNMGNLSSLAPQKSEALLCRAFSMFQLANLFCMSYNPTTADKDLGLPYPTIPEVMVDVKYERGTMAQLYSKINEDIENALPNINDDIYSTPKYHFNKKAAYAFAAKFNLFYMKYAKVVEYATAVLGSNPLDLLRNYTAYLNLGRDDIGNAFIDAANPANLLLLPAYSTAARVITGTGYARYKHNQSIASYETYWAAGPWGTKGSDADLNYLYFATKMYGSTQSVAFPKLEEFFEYTDKAGSTGYAHIVDVPFTTDETLLCRAEAYIMQEKYTEALADLNYWQKSHCRPALKNGKLLADVTLASLKTFYDALEYEPVIITTDKERSIKKKLSPQGFTVATGDQENMIQCLLHFRRIETVFTGQRWCDIKRYGLEFCHLMDGEEPIVFKAGDLRGAVQLPSDVIAAGLPQNPR